MPDQHHPDRIIAEMKSERRTQDVATYGWMPHPEDVQKLGEACARRDLRHLAAGLGEQEGVEVSVEEPDWEALREACGDVVDREEHIREVFGRAYRQTVEEGDID